MSPYEQYAAVAIGGALGSCARFAIGGAIASRLVGAFPWATFLINVTGCFIIGAFLTAASDLALVNPRVRLFVAVGFCGGYTTFSTFAWETIKLVEAQSYVLASANVAGSAVASLLATLAGVAFARGLV